jgi:hypothetical protein
MIYLKSFENFGSYTPTPFDSPKLTSYAQQTPNGLAGTYDDSINWKKLDSPLDNEYKRLSADLSPDNKMTRRKRKRFKKKVKFFKTK